MSEFTVRYVGGPTAILEIGGVRLLTDPTFDGPGDYPIGDRKLVKTAGPALAAEEVGAVDAVLLSHDQHPDNLDQSGRSYLDGVPLVLSTRSARERLGERVTALPTWTEHHVAGTPLRITALPAEHGPKGTEHITGEVTGFMLHGEGLPRVYVSGDNASLDVVRGLADRYGAFDVAVLFAGGAQTPLLGDAYLTLSSEGAAEAAKILEAREVVPLHFEHWGHFSQGPQTLVDAFAAAGLSERLNLLEPGGTVKF
ncbi:MBL fold metallo-hydrolase [Streptomyces sp. NPDC050504]|uniref:MBL fold metallo-hydrolase n=1 Tax=Streptomyces sp. NPDC050504 TaxID=3365618 RepID=UPI003793383E